MPEASEMIAGVAAALVVAAALARWAGWSLSTLAGTLAGGAVFGLLAWPPTSARDRMLLILLPAATVVELLAAFRKTPPWVGWTLRLILAGLAGLILFHRSSYLTVTWTVGPKLAWLTGIAALLAATWWHLRVLARRAPGPGPSGPGPRGRSVPLSLSAATFFAAGAVMLSGSLTTGQAGVALAGAILGAAIMSARPNLTVSAAGYVGVLIVGTFFAELPLPAALALAGAPVLAWAVEIKPIQLWRPWLRGVVRVALVCLPGVVVLGLSLRDVLAAPAADAALGY